jgi:hypothetical protein
MSITAKSTIVAVAISLKLKFIGSMFQATKLGIIS